LQFLIFGAAEFGGFLQVLSVFC